MKRKFISLFLALTVALSCAFVLTACNNDNPPPSGDGTQFYKQTFENIANSMISTSETTTPTSTVKKVDAYSSLDGFYIEAPAAYYVNVKGVAVYVKLLAEIVQNEKFQITNAPVKFTYSYSGAFNETGVAVITYKLDKDNNKVEMTWQVASDQPSGHIDIFLHIDVDYNFTACTVQSYKFYMENTIPYGTMFMSFLYKDGVLKMLNGDIDTTAVVNASNAIKQEFMQKENQIIDLQADFSAEYTRAMNIMNPPSHE